MEVAYISAVSALAGSVVGGVTSGITTWLSQRAQARAGQFAHDKSRREDLYKDFIIEASKMYAEALMRNEPQVQDIVRLYAMVSMMRVLSSRQIVECADKIIRATTDTYFAPNKTMEELHELMNSDALDPLRDFSEAVREELRMFLSR